MADRKDYVLGDGEFNLAKMEIGMMQKIKAKHPDITIYGMAEKLGISVEELSLKIVDYNLDDNYVHQGLDINQLELNLIKRARILHPTANYTELAEMIGMSVRTLHRKIKDHDIDIPKIKPNNKVIKVASSQMYRV